jgi:branched-chain amino acid transport system substrate-binding protein
MKQAGADSLFIASDSTTASRLERDCKQQGYSPTLVNGIAASGSNWKTDPNFAGILLAGSNANPFDPSLPAVAEFQAALNKGDPGLIAGNSTQASYDLIYPWSAGKLFEAAAKAGKIGPTSTPADLKKGLYALKNETLDGLAPPLNYTPGKPAYIPCYFTESIGGGKFTSMNSDKPTCLTAAQSAALAKALHVG